MSRNRKPWFWRRIAVEVAVLTVVVLLVPFCLIFTVDPFGTRVDAVIVTGLLAVWVLWPLWRWLRR